MKSDICKALQKRAKSDSFVTDNALHAQLCKLQRQNLGEKKRTTVIKFSFRTVKKKPPVMR
jgi:hypothetical protein